MKYKYKFIFNFFLCFFAVTAFTPDQNQNITIENIPFSVKLKNTDLNSALLLASGLSKKSIDKKSSSIDSNWYQKVMQNIKNDEYNITYSKELNAYQSPNRANNFRFVYNKNGFSVSPRTTEIPLFDMNDNTLPEKDRKYKTLPDWKIKFELTEYGREGYYSSFNGSEIQVSKNTAYCEDSNMKITYLNNEKGMRQDFIIRSKPEENSDKLVLKFRLITKLKTEITPDSIKFLDRSNAVVMQYTSLYVTDANGKALNAKFQKFKTLEYNIIIDDKEAVYPVTVDPLSLALKWTAAGNQTDEYFGNSVSTAGDVNADGYSDVIVGAYCYDNGQTDEGSAFVYYGSSSGLSISANWMTESNQVNAFFGISVSTAGDVNGDGYSDVIVGAYAYDNGETDEGRAYVYHGSETGLSTSANWTAESNQESANFGSVSTAGDVNGDGYSDVIVGASYYDNGQTNEGRAFVYSGSLSGLSYTPNWTADCNQAGGWFGSSVSTAGDVNGDGFSDVIVGAPGFDNGQTDEGRAFVFHGSSSGLSLTPNWTAESNQEGANFGSVSTATAGDVNGDGYSDVIVGAYAYDNGETDEGRAYVYHGSETGLSTSANWTAESNQASAYFGMSVSTAGDVNGDGYSDIIVGADRYDNGETDEGRVYVYHGSSLGLSLVPDWFDECNQTGAKFSRVSIAGDVNGDGYSDVIVGASAYDYGMLNNGRTFVYYGSASGLFGLGWYTESNQASAYFGFSVSTAGDVNSDGYSEVIVGAYRYDNGQTDEGRTFVYHGSASGLSLTPNWTAESDQASAQFGISVSTAGDVNGDGYSDVIVGAYRYDNGQTDEGRTYIFHGSASGLSLTPNWTAESDQEGAQLGIGVSTAGDVNGDGYSDVIAGAFVYDNGQTDEGRTFVYHGSASGLSLTPNWTAESDQFGAYFGWSVSSAGDVNGDGYSDVIVGAYYYDNGQTDEGRVYVYHGSASGLSLTPNWTAESDQFGAFFGYSVFTAGDVNVDGYSDVIVGAYYYDNGQTDEGSTFVYHGSASGLSLMPNWTAESDQASAYFGISVSTAGDVNGDGYSDVIVGAYLYDNGQTDEGSTFVYHGSASGLSLTPNWTAQSDQASAQFGISVSTAGDVNGDGYSDVIVGAYRYDNGQTDEGRVYVYYGNGDSGLRSTVQQYKFGTNMVIAPLGLTGLNGSVKLSGFSKSPFGRADGKLVWEIKENGQPFSGPNSVLYSGIQSGYTDISSTGQNLIQDISGLPTMKEYKWRVRTKYSPVNNPYQVYGPWRYYTSYMPVPWGCFKAQDLPLPVDLLNFSFTISDNNVNLKWSTLQEINNKGFYIERRSLKNENDWVNVAFVSGNGTTNEPKVYSFIDKGLTKGVHYYRLKQTDFNGNYEYFELPEIVNIGVPKDFSVSQNYPNPSNPKCKIDYCIPIDAMVTIKIYDIIGREVALLVNEFKQADYYSVEFDGTNFASGMYFYIINSSNFTQTKKMVLVK